MTLKKWQEALFIHCGKLFFLRMTPLFFFFLSALPLIVAMIFLLLQNSRLEELEARFRETTLKGKIALEKKGRKEQFLKRFSHPDPYFIDQQLESLAFLEKEKEQLISLIQHPGWIHNESIQERLNFLNRGENRLQFAEENIRTSSQLKETDEKQTAPVQMDEEDLQKILALLDDIPIGSFLPLQESPQLLIREFRLKIQKTPLQTEVFEVEMDLLKREFAKK
ncbi:MAG: hypothetical protein V4487_09195 [Chlamydiota bacterium]